MVPVSLPVAIDETITGMVNGNKSAKIFKWLPTTNPFIQLARKKHEPTTGVWLIDSDFFRTSADSENSTLWSQDRYSGYDPRAVGKRECKNSSIFCHPSPQCGKIMIPRYLMDLTLPFPILYPEFVYLLWL